MRKAQQNHKEWSKSHQQAARNYIWHTRDFFIPKTQQHSGQVSDKSQSSKRTEVPWLNSLDSITYSFITTSKKIKLLL